MFVDPSSEQGYTLDLTINEKEETILTILFKRGISSTYEIEYTTVVTAISGEVSNKVEYSGTNLALKSLDSKKLSVSQFSYAGGNWDPFKGMLIIEKVDNQDKLITAEAEFEIYSMVGGQKRRVGDRTYKTQDGVISIGNLEFGTYYIREISAPYGFELDEEKEAIEVNINKETGEDNRGAYVYPIENTHIKTQVTATKEWIGGPLPRPTIALQLYRDGIKYGEPVEIANGTSSYTWQELDQTDNAGGDYTYTVDEVEVPEGYDKSLSGDGLALINTYRLPTVPEEEPTNPEPPRFRPDEVPDPNVPDSPEEIIIVDEDDVPQGVFVKKEEPDGTIIYVDEDDIPFGQVGEDDKLADKEPDHEPDQVDEERISGESILVPKTGDNMPILPLAIVFILSLLSAIGLIIFKKKRYN